MSVSSREKGMRRLSTNHCSNVVSILSKHNNKTIIEIMMQMRAVFAT